MRILRLAVAAYFEIQRRPWLATRVTDMCNYLAGGNLAANRMH